MKYQKKSKPGKITGIIRSAKLIGGLLQKMRELNSKNYIRQFKRDMTLVFLLQTKLLLMFKGMRAFYLLIKTNLMF